MDKLNKFTPITLTATINKVQTVVDGGWRISFDVTEFDQPEVLRLCNFKDENLKIVIIPEDEIEYEQSRQTP